MIRRAHSIQYNGIFMTQVFSILAGLVILKVGYMNPRWIISGLCGFILLMSCLVLSNVKNLVLFLFMLSMPIAAFNYLGVLEQYHYGGAAGFFHTLYDCFLLVLYGFWFSRIMVREKVGVRFSSMDLCFWLILLMAVLSVYNASFVHFSIYELFRLFVMYLIFFYVSNNLTTKKDIQLVVCALFVGLFLESMLGMIQYSFGEILGLGLLGEKSHMVEFHSLSRVGGTLGHPNAFARYLGFLIPITISLLFSSIDKKYKMACGVLSVLAMGNLIMTFSRASWIGLLISLFSIFLISVISRLIKFKKVIAVGMLGLVLIGGLLFVYKDAILTRLLMDDYGSMNSRIPQMEIAANMIEAHPLIGIGLNNYSEVMHLYDNTPERITSYFLNTVHNVYLLIASEIGIPGLIFFLAFIFILFKKGIVILASAHAFYAPLALGILAGLVSFLVQILVMPPTLTSTSFVFFWALSAVILAISRIQKAHFSEREMAI